MKMSWFKERIPSLKEKLVLPMLLAALIPVTVFMLMVTLTINRSNYAAGRAAADELVQTLAGEISALEANASSTAQTLVSSPTVRDAFRTLADEVSAAEELDYYRILSETVMISTAVDDFFRIRIYLPDSNLLTKEEFNFYSIAELEMDELPESMRLSQNRAGWTEWRRFPGGFYYPTETMLKSCWMSSVVRGKSGGELYVAVDISMSSLQRLMTGHNEIICEYSLYGKDGERLMRCGTPVSVSDKQLYRAQMELSDGTLLCIDVDLSQFISDITPYLKLLLYVSLFCLVLIPLATLLILNKQCRDLENLAVANLMMAEGDYKLIEEDADTREVRTIQRTHNEMVMYIEDLIHNVYEETIEKQEAQLNCLFEQIKPHFLYNILESGKWMAIREGDQRTAKFLEKLAKYFRVGLGAGMDQVPLSSEIEHAALYIELLNMRLSKHITLETQVEPEALDYPVLRMLLQPLVENAVEHGICAQEGPQGTVKIIAKRTKNELRICVENDGADIPPEKLEALNRGDGFGIGISNIQKRLKLFYEEGCTIRLSNRDGGGVRTTISIRFNPEHSIFRVEL